MVTNLGAVIKQFQTKHLGNERWHPAPILTGANILPGVPGIVYIGMSACVYAFGWEFGYYHLQNLFKQGGGAL